MTHKQFTRRVEDFTCENCQAPVTGNGYTNHCPQCLYSKHVDINPGDRAADCGGLMKPIGLDIKKGHYIIIHECLKCGHQKRNKSVPEDNSDALIQVSKAPLNT